MFMLSMKKWNKTNFKGTKSFYTEACKLQFHDKKSKYLIFYYIKSGPLIVSADSINLEKNACSKSVVLILIWWFVEISRQCRNDNNKDGFR